MLRATNGVAGGEFDDAAVTGWEAVTGDEITTAFDIEDGVQFEGGTLSQILPWHLNENWQESALTQPEVRNETVSARSSVPIFIFLLVRLRIWCPLTLMISEPYHPGKLLN